MIVTYKIRPMRNVNKLLRLQCRYFRGWDLSYTETNQSQNQQERSHYLVFILNSEDMTATLSEGKQSKVRTKKEILHDQGASVGHRHTTRCLSCCQPKTSVMAKIYLFFCHGNIILFKFQQFIPVFGYHMRITSD